MYCYQNGITNVFDFPIEDARHQRKRLLGEGWTIYHSVVV